MNKQHFGVRAWLWLSLGIIIIIALAFIGWMKFSGKNVIVATSPTPVKTAAVSPSTQTNSPQANASPTGGTTQKTATPGTTSVPTATFAARKLGKSDEGCVPTVSFSYPENYKASMTGGTPSVGGADWVEIYDSNGNNAAQIRVTPVSYTHKNDYSPLACVTPPYSSLEDYATRNSISGYTSKTINGLPAIQYSDASGKKTIVFSSPNKIVSVSMGVAPAEEYVYDIIANSITVQ